MIFARDPLADPGPLVHRVYAYVAYRLGEGPDAEDVTSDVFERALRARASYNPSRGSPEVWLVGIARRAIADWARRRPNETLSPAPPEPPARGEVAEETTRRLTLQAALAGLNERDTELLALRYGADLTARQIARLLNRRTNSVEVALHRALGRLRAQFEAGDAGEAVRVRPVQDV